MHSQRLCYRPLAAGDLDAFHQLVCDPHVRRYLMDGERMPRAWSEARIADSEALFARRGVGLWLARARAAEPGASLPGFSAFCGFLVLPAVDPEPQLVYALPARFTGRGLATEMARRAIAAARAQQGFDEIVAAVDAPNLASLRVLEKLGFTRVGVRPGAFGDELQLRLRGPCG